MFDIQADLMHLAAEIFYVVYYVPQPVPNLMNGFINLGGEFFIMPLIYQVEFGTFYLDQCDIHSRSSRKNSKINCPICDWEL